MKTIQVAFEEDLLEASDRAARRRKQNRSAFIREAVREHLRRIHALEREAADLKGYEAVPETDEMAVWDRVAAWPEG